MPLLYKSQLVTAKGIEGINQKFQSTSNDPHIVFNHMPIKRGWYRLRISQVSPRPLFTAKIYPDYGSGTSEEDALDFVLANDDPGRIWVYFPKDVFQLRYDPLAAPGEFQLNYVELKKAPACKIYFHALKRAASKILRHPKKAKLAFAENQGVFNKKQLQLYNYYQPHTSSDGVHSLEAYQYWISKYESSLPQDLKTAAAEIKTWPTEKLPFFSIVMPVYNTDADLLNRAIETVLEQAYPHWELCIADDASPAAHLRPLLEQWAAKDKRIKVVFREKNGHISANSNSALELVTGDYCVLMDHDDEIRPHSLYEVAKILIEKPDTLFVYSDQDIIDIDGNRSSPLFKPQYNPELLYTQNYLNHLTVLQTERLKNIGGWRLGYEGSQDHDLYLRYLHEVSHDRIHHIPKVLYHWRAIEGSAAMGIDQKSYAVDAGLKCVSDYFQNIDPAINVSLHKSLPHYRVHWPLPAQQPKVSLIIPTKDMAEMTEACVKKIITLTAYQNYEIIIISNNSEEPETFAFFEKIQQEHPQVRVLEYNYPFNYSAINNYGVKHAEGEIIGLVNNDIDVINAEWLSEMVSNALRPEVGCVGAKLFFEDGTIQHAGVILGLGGYAAHSHRGYPESAPGYFGRIQLPQNLSAVTAALLIVQKDIYEEVNGLDEENFAVAYNDVDFCLKVMEKGYLNVYTPYAEAYHYESKTRGDDNEDDAKKQRFDREKENLKTRWDHIIQNDPNYSPNLTTSSEDFGYKI